MSPDQNLEFGVLYGQNCAGCHGSDGEFGPAPPLNDPLFRAIVPEKELQSILTKGRKKALMPAFAKENGGLLTEAQFQVLVLEIKGVPYKIVKKDDGETTKVEIVPDAGGISPTGAPPKRRPRACRPTAASGKLPRQRHGRREKGCRGLCPGLRGLSWRPRAGHPSGRRDCPHDSRTRVAGPDQQSGPSPLRNHRTPRPRHAELCQARPDNPDFLPLTDEEVTDLVALLVSWRREK